MYPIHDHDVLLLLACALAAKRRPAELPELVAAIDLLRGNVPSEEKLAEAFARLGKSGLLLAVGPGLQLTAVAESLIERLPVKGEAEERLAALRRLLSDLPEQPAGEPVTVEAGTWSAAIFAHRAAAASPAKNLLVPKPKPEAAQARPGQRARKPLGKKKPARRG